MLPSREMKCGLPGSSRRTKEMDASRWGKVDRPKMRAQRREPARPVLTAGCWRVPCCWFFRARKVL